jgi:hypothetical protein
MFSAGKLSFEFIAVVCDHPGENVYSVTYDLNLLFTSATPFGKSTLIYA